MAIIPSTADQYWSNVSNPFKWDKPIRGNRQIKRVEEPIILWKKEYEKNQTAFFNKIQEISDYMLLNGNSLYSFNNDNQPYLIDAVRGVIDAERYKTAEYTYGERGASQIRDHRFYYAAKSQILGEVSAQPFKFDTKNISNQLIESEIKKMSKDGAKLVTNLMADIAAQNGIDLEFVKDKNVNLNGTEKEVYQRLDKREKLNNIIYKLIQHVNYNHDLQDILRDCFDTKFDVNAEFAIVEVINDEIIPKHLRPDQVSWIASKKVKTMEDPAVVACCAIDFLSFTEIMNKYGMQLNTGTGAAGILDAMEKIRTNTLGSYNPESPYFTQYFQMANRLTSDYSQPDPTFQPENILSINYMNNCFYPFQRAGQGLSYSILEQKNYFKMIVPTRYVVEFDGKSINKTMWEKWMKDDYSRELIPQFTELGSDEKTPKGAFVVDKTKTEVWEATRLGHGTLINVGKYEYTANFKGRSNYVGFPIIAQISYKESFALVGYQLAVYSNVTYNRLEELINTIGHSSAILIDSASGMDPMSFIYNARKTGIAIYNSTKMGGAPTAAQLHLSTIKVSNHIEEINQMLALLGMFKITFENMIGASPQTQGIAQPYAGAKETQLNIANQSMLKSDKYREHTMFSNQLLQRIADIAKVVFAKDGVINVSLGNGEKEILRLTKDLKWADFDVFLESGMVLANKKNIIDQAVMQLMSSGGIEILDELMDVLVTDNPNEARALLREGKEKLLAAQAAQQQAMAQQAQMQAQVEAQKLQVPLQREGIITEREIQIQQMKMEDRATQLDGKGNLTDIQHQQGLQNKVVDTELRMDEETHRAALQNSISQSGQQTTQSNEQ